MTVAHELDQKLREAGLEIWGVRLPSETERSTWRVDWKKEPTAEQTRTMDQIIATFDVATVKEPVPVFEQLVRHLVDIGVVVRDDLPAELQSFVPLPTKLSATEPQR